MANAQEAARLPTDDGLEKLMADPTLGPAAKIAYYQLWKLAEYRQAYINISPRVLGFICGKSASAARDWLETLRQYGLIDVITRDDRSGVAKIFIYYYVPGLRAVRPDPQLQLPLVFETMQDIENRSRVSPTQTRDPCPKDREGVAGLDQENPRPPPNRETSGATHRVSEQVTHVTQVISKSQVANESQVTPAKPATPPRVLAGETRDPADFPSREDIRHMSDDCMSYARMTIDDVVDDISHESFDWRPHVEKAREIARRLFPNRTRQAPEEELIFLLSASILSQTILSEDWLAGGLTCKLNRATDKIGYLVRTLEVRCWEWEGVCKEEETRRYQKSLLHAMKPFVRRFVRTHWPKPLPTPERPDAEDQIAPGDDGPATPEQWAIAQRNRTMAKVLRNLDRVNTP